MDTKSAGCIFCSIVNGVERAHLVWADDETSAFLDVRPLFPGHTLVVPHEHFETLDELPSERVEGLFMRVKEIEAAVVGAMGAEGSFIAVNNRVSQSVPHLHVHVVPRRKGDGLKGFFWPRKKYAGDDAMAEVAFSIKRWLQR